MAFKHTNSCILFDAIDGAYCLLSRRLELLFDTKGQQEADRAGVSTVEKSNSTVNSSGRKFLDNSKGLVAVFSNRRRNRESAYSLRI